MADRITQIALVVADYDEALAWFVDKLGFVCLEDEAREGGKRWVRVAPAADAAFSLLLARAATPEQATRVGNQAGGRVFLFLETDDFARDHAAFSGRGVRFVEEPRHESYGTVCVFEDLYGNRWDLIERGDA
jgi:catechol 2,3-dioxygenase-like lactoylglutathione lyase family enzyme